MNNVVILAGRLVANPELRTFQNGADVVNFTLAVSRNYKNKDGEYLTDFIDCVVIGAIAKTLHEYCEKGDFIGVRGSLQKHSYKTKEGTNKYLTRVMVEKITFLSTGKKEETATKNEENVKVQETDENMTVDPFSAFNSEHAEELDNLELPF